MSSRRLFLETYARDSNDDHESFVSIDDSQFLTADIVNVEWDDEFVRVTWLEDWHE